MKKYIFAQLPQVVQNIINNKQKLVYIAGASASGKSYIAEELAKKLESAGKSVLTISSDNYYIADSTIKSVMLGTYDHPKLIDYQLLADDITKYFAEGKFMLPQYSFSESRRTGYIPVEKKADVVIVEGLYTISQLPANNALKIFISSSPEDLIIRRLLRDPSRVGEPLYMIVGALNNVFPMRNLYGKVQESNADIIIENDYDLLEKDGQKMFCRKLDVSKMGDKKLIMEEEVIEYTYDDSSDNDDGLLLIHEYYQDGFLKSVGISKAKAGNRCEEDGAQRISMRIYKAGILTQLHALLQNAGLKYEGYTHYTQTTYEDNTGKHFVVEDRDSGKVIRYEA